MLSLEVELKDHLKTLTYPYDVTVRPSYSKLSPSYPMVTIQEIGNTTRQAISGTEKYADIAYQVDIFSKDIYPESGVTVCRNIASVVDSDLQSTYGLLRTSQTRMPDPTDNSVSRMTLRYSGILDTNNEYIYH